MKRYDFVLFDADNTLFDFDRAEHEALRLALEAFSIPCTPETEARYVSINSGLWAMLDRGEATREWLVVERFARLTRYHADFRSCNVGSKTDSWRGHCPKCLFVWVILSPFLSTGQLESIFGRNLAEDETLWETLCQLCGMTVEKQDPKDTEGIPTGLIHPEGTGGWTITCAVVPTHYGSIVGTYADFDAFAAEVDPTIEVIRKLER